jgi:hypothetical protein
MTPTIVIAVCCFLLGWLSCSMVYFFRSMRISITTIKMAYVFYLVLINRGLEFLYYAHMNRMSALRKNGKTPGHSEYEHLKADYYETIEIYKENSVFFLRRLQPDAFKSLLTFEDWASAQDFLEQHRDLAFKFTKETQE